MISIEKKPWNAAARAHPQMESMYIAKPYVSFEVAQRDFNRTILHMAKDGFELNKLVTIKEGKQMFKRAAKEATQWYGKVGNIDLTDTPVVIVYRAAEEMRAAYMSLPTYEESHYSVLLGDSMVLQHYCRECASTPGIRFKTASMERIARELRKSAGTDARFRGVLQELLAKELFVAQVMQIAASVSAIMKGRVARDIEQALFVAMLQARAYEDGDVQLEPISFGDEKDYLQEYEVLPDGSKLMYDYRWTTCSRA